MGEISLNYELKFEMSYSLNVNIYKIKGKKKKISCAPNHRTLKWDCGMFDL